MKVNIEKKKRRGKALGFYLDEKLVEKFTNKVKEINSDKTKVIRALIEAWIKEA